MHRIAGREHQEAAARFRQLYSTYQAHRDLIAVGAYRRGSDARVDAAIDHWPRILDFMRQDMLQPTSFAASLEQLRAAMAGPAAGRAAA